MSLQRLVREARKRLGMTQQQLADAVGVSRGSVHQWETNRGLMPKRAVQPALAKALGITVAQLLAAADGQVQGLVPLLGEAQALRVAGAGGANFRHEAGEMVPANVDAGRRTFAWRVQGDSMVGQDGDSFPEGSILIVEPDMEALEGDYVLVRDGGGQIVFKQLVKLDGEYRIKPLNPRYPSKPLGAYPMVGVVRSFSKRYR